MKILVPVDFHKASFSAYNYAAHLSEVFPKAELTLLHVLNGTFSTNEMVAYEPLMDMQSAAKERIRFFHTAYPTEMGIEVPPVSLITDVRFGIPGFTIAEYAAQHQYDLIVMGTRDKHGIFDRVLGSASGIVVRQASCPTILIHENVRFIRPTKVVFAFDDKSDIEGAIANYKVLNSILHANTHFVHVHSDKDEQLDRQRVDIVEELMEDQAPSFSFEIKSITGNDMQMALRDYCLFEKADMLAMMHRKEGVFTSIFRKQNSVKMAQEFHLPVIVFQES